MGRMQTAPFAFQASAQGLGVESSVGAAVLAPPGTPGVWSLDPDEEASRKALLKEAVGHSHLAILLRFVPHFTATLLSDIDIHSLVASYEHGASSLPLPPWTSEERGQGSCSRR